jgi:hypothetical protein
LYLFFFIFAPLLWFIIFFILIYPTKSHTKQALKTRNI